MVLRPSGLNEPKAGAVNAAGVQKDLDFFLQQGWVTGQVKASDVIDMSFARKASAELGPYQRKSP